VAEKSGLKFFYLKTYFSTNFDPKHLKNHDKPIHALKKLKTHSKNQNKLGTKKKPSSDLFFMNFKGKKNI